MRVRLRFTNGGSPVTLPEVDETDLSVEAFLHMVQQHTGDAPFRLLVDTPPKLLQWSHIHPQVHPASPLCTLHVPVHVPVSVPRSTVSVCIHVSRYMCLSVARSLAVSTHTPHPVLLVSSLGAVLSEGAKTETKRGRGSTEAWAWFTHTYI